MKKKLIISLLLAVISLGSYWIIQSGSIDRTISVKVETLEPGSFNEELIFQGVVFPKENIPISINTPTVIRKILVKEGNEIQVGDTLLEFSDTTKENLRRELEVINLNISSTKLELNNMRSGSMKLSLEELELEQTSLEEKIKSLNREIELATFEAETLGKQADAMNELLKKNGISSMQANEAKALANKKRNDLEDLKTSLEIYRQRYDLSVLSYQRLRRELLLNQNNITSEYQKLLSEKADIEKKLSAIEAPLKSEIGGIITEIIVSEGDSVPQGGKLMSISPGNEFLIRLEVPLNQSKWIKLGQKARVTTKGDFEKKNYQGEVSNIAKIAKITEVRGIQERVIEMEILVEDSKGLKPGYTTDVEISGEYQEGIYTINPFSVIEEEGETYVFVVEDDIAKKTPVDIGIKTMSKYEVLNLPLGTEIVINPFKVRDGQRVTVTR